MSGHGGGGGDWRDNPKIIPKPKTGSGGGGQGAVPDVCNITEDTNLNSVVRAVLGTLRVGDRLAVEFEPGPPQRLVAKSAGVVAGSITSPSMLQFIACIQGGVDYEAEVLSIRGGQCQVRISVK